MADGNMIGGCPLGASLGNLTGTDPRYSTDPDAALARHAGRALQDDVISGNLLVFGYEASHAALVNRSTSRDPMREKGMTTPAAETSIMQLDEPEHGRVRRALLSTLSPRTRTFEPVAKRHAHTLLAALGDDRPFDVVEDYALPFATNVMASLYGVNPVQRNGLMRWMVDLSLAFELQQDEEQARRYQNAFRKISGFLYGASTLRRMKRSDDWICDIVRQTDLTNIEITHTLRMTILASVFPLCAFVSSALRQLLLHPEQMERLRCDPSLCDDAIEEALRFDPPGEAVSRGSFEGVDILDAHVAPFRQIEVMVRSANHDPKAFDDPDVFDITARRERMHLSFGSGYRMCLGAGFARMVGKVAILSMLDRFGTLSPADPDAPAKWRPLPILRMLETLPAIGTR